MNEIIAKKKELSFVGNTKLEILRLDTEIKAAETEGNFEKAEEIRKKKESLELMTIPNKNASDDWIAQLNKRNNDRNYIESMESYKASLIQKRQQGDIF